MKSDRLFWALVIGILGGFAFAAGSTLWTKTEPKLGIADSTAGADVPGARTAQTPGVY